MDRKTQGGVSQSFCVAYFADKNYIVSQTMFDDAKYDLIVDDGTRLLKVQCKTSHYKNIERLDRKHCKTYPMINLMKKVKKGIKPPPLYKKGDFDFLWIMTSSSFYLIPESEIFNDDHPSRTVLILSPVRDKFIVDVPLPKEIPIVRQMPESILTNDVKTQIESMVESGYKTSNIADALNLTIHTVSNHIYRSGIRKRILKVIKPEWKPEIIQMYKTGKTPTEISQRFELNIKTVGSFLAYHKSTVNWYDPSQLAGELKADSTPVQNNS